MSTTLAPGDDGRTVLRAPRAGASHRPELEGLRALAVALVVVHHVWFNRVSGGVDVFFLVSGFLLTGQLHRAAGRGRLEVVDRWSRTAVRLLPTAFTVLLATVLAGLLLLPEGRWAQTAREVAASALFVQNWQLAADAVDYAAQNAMASVVQHFWSLSIQVQFLLLWPLLVGAVVRTCPRDPALLRGRLTLAALAVFAASFAFSVGLVATDQPLAYFHTLARLWEFALGALLALHLDRIELPGRVRILIGWIGVVGLLLCGPVLPVALFPGVAALWPTGCAALILLAGSTGARGGADRVLRHRALQHLGGLSFALYLWHWPVLVLHLVVSGQERVGLLDGLGIIGVSLVLAVATHHLVEVPLVRAPLSTRRRFRSSALGLVVVLVAVAGWQGETLRRADVPERLPQSHPGALALAGGAVEEAPLLPPPVSVYEDWVRIERWDCAPTSRTATDLCAQPTGPEPPERRILLVGDSHVQQLAGAFAPLAQRHGWQLLALVRGACPFSTASEVDPDDLDCLAWLDAATEEIAALRPDAVVTLATRDVRAGLTEQMPPGFVEQWRRLQHLGVPVLAVRDNPRFDSSMPDCVQRQGRGSPVCGVVRDAVYSAQPPWTGAVDVPANVSFLDIADAVCTADHCPAEVGNVLVYLDDNHLTATYAASMAELLEEDVLTALAR